jgi:uncharacterized protein YjbI with pentapeptide repeats
MKFGIFNRWSGDLQFTAEIECAKDTPTRVKLGLSVKWAYESGAILRDADLSGAILRDAILSDAILSDAILSGAILSGANLRGADMSRANLSGAILRDADLSGAILSGADMSRADMSGADLRGADMSGAILSVANLRGADMSGAILSGADMSGAILSGADMSGANLSVADLRGADMSGAILSGANLRDAPIIPNIHQAIYAAASADRALDMGEWHKCETTHCRAGWAVHLAGAAGYELEEKIGSAAAGALIYLASDPDIGRMPNFYTTNELALADMKARAEAEKAKGAAS